MVKILELIQPLSVLFILLGIKYCKSLENRN
jgi:hypothetical protein